MRENGFVKDLDQKNLIKNLSLKSNNYLNYELLFFIEIWLSKTKC